MTKNDIEQNLNIPLWVEEFLQNAEERGRIRSLEKAKSVTELLEHLRSLAVERGNQDNARITWCLREILHIQETYIDSFYLLKAGKFYDAWCLLEKVELGINALYRHIEADTTSYKIELIERLTSQLQSLYPYKVFLSPGFVSLDKRCSICGEQVSIRKSCGHIPGDLYDGELCHRIIHRADLLELSLVEKPANKYAVGFLIDPTTNEPVDHYDYVLVNYVATGLRYPFDDWCAEWTTIRHPHSRFKNLGRNAPCPCESGKKYKSCCLWESGVLRPHLQVSFAIPPPSNLPQFGYFDELSKSKPSPELMSSRSIGGYAIKY